MKKETKKQTNKQKTSNNERKKSAAFGGIRSHSNYTWDEPYAKLQKEQQFRSLALEEIKKVSILTKANSSNKHERQFPTLTDNSKFFAQAKIFFVPADSCINSAKNLAYYEQY